jgi:adenylosuccinate synthase
MGRTIGIKLSEKEERIVNQLTREGVSHSELLREALWNFFTPTHKSVDQEENEEKQELNIDTNTNIFNPIIADYIEHLKEEINKLREENFRLQEQIRNEVSRLRLNLHRITPGYEVSRQTYNYKDLKSNPDVDNNINKSIPDVDNNINSSLRKETKKFEFKRI